MGDDAKAIFPRRLRQARTMRTYSLRRLAEALKGAVSHNALAKYENGEMMPGTVVLGQLAAALEQPPDFFFRPFTLHLDHIRFRKRTRLGVKVEDALREQALEFFERYHEVEELLGDVRKYVAPLQVEPLHKPEQAEVCADSLRKIWKLGRDPLPNVQELLETNGIKVYEAETDEDAFDGFSAHTESGPVIVVAQWLNRNLLRKRMTEVHEVTHIVLPLAESLSDVEEEAIVKRFAGAFLLPKETFIASFGGRRSGISLGELIELKVNFGASIWAIMMRARQLELISEAVFVRFCQSASGWRKAGEPGDERYQGNESHSRFKQLVHRAVAEEHISTSKGATLLHQSLGDFRKELRRLFS